MIPLVAGLGVGYFAYMRMNDWTVPDDPSPAGMIGWQRKNALIAVGLGIGALILARRFL